MRFETVLANCPTSGTTTQDITVSGATTPIGAIIQVSSATADGTIVQGSLIGFGLTDGTRHRSGSAFSQNGAAILSNTGGRASTSNVLEICFGNGSGANGAASFNAWINTGTVCGIQILWSDNVSTALLMAVTLVFAEDSTEFFYVGDVTTDPDLNDPKVVTGLPGIPRALIGFTGDLGASFNNLRIQPGVACKTTGGSIQQACFSMYEQDAELDALVSSVITSSYFHVLMAATSVATAAEVTDLGTTTGFTLTTRLVGAATNIFYAAIGTHRELWVGVPAIDTRTVSDEDITSGGFPVQTTVAIATALIAIDTVATTATAGLVSFGISSFVPSTQNNCSSLQSEDGAATTDTRSVVDGDALVRVVNNVGDDDWTAAATAMLSNGVRLAISDGSPGANDRKAAFLLIGRTATLFPGGIASTTAFGTPTIVRGAVTVSPTGIASTSAFGTATIVRGAVTLSPTGIASTTAFGTPTIVAGAVTVTPAGIASTSAFGTPTIVAGAVTVSPTGIASTSAFGTATITTLVTVLPAGIASTTAFGTPTITTGAVTISPAGIASTTAFGTAMIVSGANIAPAGIASTTAFGTPTITTLVTVLPAGIASTTAFGTPTITTLVTVLPAGIASTTAFGTPTIVAGAFTILPTGIASTTAFGNATIVAGAVTVTPAGIASTTAFGTATITTLVTVLPAGIASTTAFGTPTITTGAVTVSPTGIASTTAFGTATFIVDVGGAQIILVEGIPSSSVVGTPFIRGGVIPTTMKKRIHDALCEAAALGTFVEVSYESDVDFPCSVLEQGLQVAPSSIEVNELTNRYRVEGRKGRSFQQDNDRWLWLLILRFEQEVIAELFEQGLLDDPICVHRLTNAPEERQVRLILLDSSYDHPPREGASNGTEIQYRFEAVLSPK